jgi:hypothetical protein
MDMQTYGDFSAKQTQISPGDRTQEREKLYGFWRVRRLVKSKGKHLPCRANQRRIRQEQAGFQLVETQIPTNNIEHIRVPFTGMLNHPNSELSTKTR